MFTLANNFQQSFGKDYDDIEATLTIWGPENVYYVSLEGEVVEDSFLLDIEQGQNLAMWHKNVGASKDKRGENLAVGLNPLIIDVFEAVLINDFGFL